MLYIIARLDWEIKDCDDLQTLATHEVSNLVLILEDAESHETCKVPVDIYRLRHTDENLYNYIKDVIEKDFMKRYPRKSLCV
jgi:hypothetical protein